MSKKPQSKDLVHTYTLREEIKETVKALQFLRHFDTIPIHIRHKMDDLCADLTAEMDRTS